MSASPSLPNSFWPNQYWPNNSASPNPTPPYVTFPALEEQGFIFSLADLQDGTGTYAMVTHDLAGGLLVSDQPFYIEGYRLQLHDNGDGTYSPVTTTSTGPNDVAVEWQGFRIKLHPTGANATIGPPGNQTTVPMYAIVVVQV